MTRYEAVRDAVAGFLFALGAVTILALVLAVAIPSCSAPAARLTVREDVRRELGGDLGADWHARDLAIAAAQPTPGCYGRACFCPYHCGPAWRLGAAHHVWRPTAAECNCAA